MRLKVFVRSFTLIFSFSNARLEPRSEAFSLSSLMDAFLELLFEVMEALDEDIEGDGSLATLFLVGRGGGTKGNPTLSGSSSNVDLDVDLDPMSK